MALSDVREIFSFGYALRRAVSEAGAVHANMDENSSRTLTGCCCVTSFSGDLQNIHANGYHLFADGTEIL